VFRAAGLQAVLTSQVAAEQAEPEAILPAHGP
jgi:hypothetical protein